MNAFIDNLNYNGGIKETRHGIPVEILSHKFHNPYYDIICVYQKGYSPKIGNIVLVYCYNRPLDKNEQESLTVYRHYVGCNSHYTSRNFKPYDLHDSSLQHVQMFRRLKQLATEIDFNKYTKRQG